MTRINRRSFLAEMRSLLAFMDADDRAHVLRFYEKLFDQAGEEGEGALLKKLGSPVRQVLQVEKLYRDKQKAEELSDAVGPVEEAIAAVEEPVMVPAEAVEEKEPAQPEVVETAAFAVPDEEDAVDFSAEEEEPAPEQPETEILSEPVEETEEAAAEFVEGETLPLAEESFEEIPGEELSEIQEQTDDKDEAVTEIVPAPDEELAEEEAEETAEDEETEEDEEEAAESGKEPVGAGRVVAAVFVTIPMIFLVLIGFGLSLSLGFSSMGVGVVFGAVGGYFSGYAFGGITTFLPDILLLTGGMLLCFCLALFFLWLGIWLAVGGVRLTIRIVAAVYRGILKRGGQDHE